MGASSSSSSAVPITSRMKREKEGGRGNPVLRRRHPASLVVPRVPPPPPYPYPLLSPRSRSRTKRVDKNRLDSPPCSKKAGLVSSSSQRPTQIRFISNAEGTHPYTMSMQRGRGRDRESPIEYTV